MEAAIAEILRATAEQEEVFKDKLIQQQKAWTKKQTELESQLTGQSVETEKFLTEWQAKQDAEREVHRERVHQKEQKLKKEKEDLTQKIVQLKQQELERLEEQQRELDELNRQEEINQRNIQEQIAELEAVPAPPPPAEVPAPEEIDQPDPAPEEGASEAKRRKLKYLVAGTPPIRHDAADTVTDMPKQFTILLEEGIQNDYITDWGRCCIAGTGSKTSAFVVSKQKCFLDLSSVQQLTLSLLDGTHLSKFKYSNESLVKIEILVYA